jgi:hypothetical protein
MNSRKILFLLLLPLMNELNAQLKFIVEDFEGYADGVNDLKENGLFAFGDVKANIDSKIHEANTTRFKDYLGQKALKIETRGQTNFGGWGKGIGLNVELEKEKDFLNFYVRMETENENYLNESSTIKIELQEDDNINNVYQKEMDDSWTYTQTIVSNELAGSTNSGDKKLKKWKLISIPLEDFKDANPGGDNLFNINYKEGKLFCIVISFFYPQGDFKKLNGKKFFFDFICFSKGKLTPVDGISEPPQASNNDFCILGAWSKEGNTADFIDIGHVFENNFKPDCKKKIGVVHFFQPFATDGGNKQNQFPSEERISKVIKEGYIPMITLENHFVNTDPSLKQPNLYSIVEGHFDVFFGNWAKQIKEVKGIVLLRILHEFNGNWYPWSIVKNDKDPQLLIRAFRHIRKIFREKNVTNVKFIWCPNSMSIPQEPWNYIMKAYPGDEYVDYVGLDIYNGAGEGSIWRSFKKEGIENYFLLTQKIPLKSLFVCEVASRERRKNEPSSAQGKEEWIRQMSEALKSDMSKIRLLTWFNEKETFKINSSAGSKNAYLNYIMKDDYFKPGLKCFSID